MLAVRPGADKCMVAIAPAEKVVDRFVCPIEECAFTCPSRQGLANHVGNHRRNLALAAAAAPLPIPATRQGLRDAPACPAVAVEPVVGPPSPVGIAVPVSPRGVSLTPSPTPRRESPRNVRYDIVVASPGFWRPRLSGGNGELS